ncbi:MAG: DUF4277 domain-containing protein, partial [Candidatus Riflebacteria bacterium]|nr:DUF4277 domain-containing protein [Candidatus Riflebacteria bacterium]
MPEALQRSPEVHCAELGPLPIVMHYLRQLQVRDLIDKACPPHSLQDVTHGECIEGFLLANIEKGATIITDGWKGY